MSNSYSLLGINKVQLAINLGLTYDKLVRYRHSDINEFAEWKDFIENYVYGENAEGEGYKFAQMSGLPILDRYAELTYYNDDDGIEMYCLLDTLLVTVERSKEIVKNSILGIEGTVKEYINKGDFIITITGTLAGENRYLYPEEKLMSLITLCNVPDSIEVNNSYLNTFWGVNKLVVESFTFSQSEKYSNIILYTLNCLSDSVENSIIT